VSSITTMLAGSLYGKKYSRIQVVAVLLLTVGVIIAAWSDAQTKVRLLSTNTPIPIRRREVTELQRHGEEDRGGKRKRGGEKTKKKKKG